VSEAAGSGTRRDGGSAAWCLRRWAGIGAVSGREGQASGRCQTYCDSGGVVSEVLGRRLTGRGGGLHHASRAKSAAGLPLLIPLC
jgi:hypothetical protein